MVTELSFFSESDFCLMNGQGYHYHPIDCKKYVYCNVGHITEQSCPGDLVYDLSSGTGQCTFKDNVPCAREMVESTSVVP